MRRPVVPFSALPMSRCQAIEKPGDAHDFGCAPGFVVQRARDASRVHGTRASMGDAIKTLHTRPALTIVAMPPAPEDMPFPAGDVACLFIDRHEPPGGWLASARVSCR